MLNSIKRTLLLTLGLSLVFINNDTQPTIAQSRQYSVESFRRAWSKVDPLVAPFLGTWLDSDEGSIKVYPSKTKGRVCIIGEEEGYASLSTGYVSNKQIRYSIGSNFFSLVWIGQKNVIVARGFEFSDDRLKAKNLFPPLSIHSDVKNKFKTAGCTASLPSRR